MSLLSPSSSSTLTWSAENLSPTRPWSPIVPGKRYEYFSLQNAQTRVPGARSPMERGATSRTFWEMEHLHKKGSFGLLKNIQLTTRSSISSLENTCGLPPLSLSTMYP